MAASPNLLLWSELVSLPFVQIYFAWLFCKSTDLARCIFVLAGYSRKKDALANLGTVLGGVLVSLTKTALPDLVLGLIICVVVVRGGIEIVRNAHSSESHEAISKES
jgi:hypothetical protein